MKSKFYLFKIGFILGFVLSLISVSGALFIGQIVDSSSMRFNADVITKLRIMALAIPFYFGSAPAAYATKIFFPNPKEWGFVQYFVGIFSVGFVVGVLLFTIGNLISFVSRKRGK